MKNSILIRIAFLVGLLSMIVSCNTHPPIQNANRDEYVAGKLPEDSAISENLENGRSQYGSHSEDDENARNIELTILPQYTKVQNDSLYFKYRMQNNSDTVFVFYNVGMVDFIIFGEDEDDYYKYDPRLTMFIYNKNNEFQSKKWGKELSFKDPGTPREPMPYGDSIQILSFGKHIVLNPRESIEYCRQLYVKNFELEKGIYQFQLRYWASSGSYRERYTKDQKKNNRLKNSVLFEGEIRSNFCSFDIGETKQKE